MNNKLVFKANNNIYELIDQKDEQLKEEIKNAIKYFLKTDLISKQIIKPYHYNTVCYNILFLYIFVV